MVLQKTQSGIEYLDVTLDFKFMGGSLGCAEAKKIILSCDYALEHCTPVVFKASSGGIRMQEGPTALMGMASTASAVQRVRQAGVLTISVFVDPCYGGSSASFMYATAIQIGIREARMGFAGPSVIKNTLFNGDDQKYYDGVPAGFQSADRAVRNGLLDMLVPAEECRSTTERIIDFFEVRETI